MGNNAIQKILVLMKFVHKKWKVNRWYFPFLYPVYLDTVIFVFYDVQVLPVVQALPVRR